MEEPFGGVILSQVRMHETEEICTKWKANSISFLNSTNVFLTLSFDFFSNFLGPKRKKILKTTYVLHS